MIDAHSLRGEARRTRVFQPTSRSGSCRKHNQNGAAGVTSGSCDMILPYREKIEAERVFDNHYQLQKQEWAKPKMKSTLFSIITGLVAFFLSGMFSAHPEQPMKPEPENGRGYLEIECNLANVKLHACPRDRFERETIRMFFGLFTSHRTYCSGQAVLLGTTPIGPVQLPEGDYVLQISPGYVWEHQGPVEVRVVAGGRTFLPLKLFKRNESGRSAGLDGPDGAPGVSGGSGSGTGGVAGPPPQ